jgi:ribulose-phosphate 3-epimerase
MGTPIHIAPSILSAGFVRLGEEVRAIEAAGADLVHVDLMDNHYVPNLTIGPLVCQAIRPHVTIPLDVHLMAEPVDALIPPFAAAGADLITFHPEASRHVDRTLGMIRECGCRAGLAFNPATPLFWLDHLMDRLDLGACAGEGSAAATREKTVQFGITACAQGSTLGLSVLPNWPRFAHVSHQSLLPRRLLMLIMSVNPSFGGQSFLPASLAKLAEARRRIDRRAASGGQPVRLQVGGGVKADNIGKVAAAGAHTFAGSAVFGAPDDDGGYGGIRRRLRRQALER